jgi:hypothetical protein
MNAVFYLVKQAADGGSFRTASFLAKQFPRFLIARKQAACGRKLWTNLSGKYAWTRDETPQKVHSD